MDKKQSAVKKALKAVEGKGFYIILSLCVIAIGVSGYVLFFTDTMDSDQLGAAIDIDSLLTPDTPDTPDIPVNGEQPDGNEDKEPSLPDQPTGQEPTTPTDPQPTDPSGNGDTPTYQVTKAVAPTGGKVIKEFSGDKLVYDETMEDWRTHNGTDFSCTKGDSVFVIRDGTVVNVFEDGLFGYSVSVEHDGGIVSTYSGLSSASVVKKGDKVKMGDTIGTAGGTAIAETNQAYHIHVSVTKDGKYIDVMSLF